MSLLFKIAVHTPRIWPDSLFLRIKFYYLMGYRLNLRNPKTFSEKLQWLKLHDRRPEYTRMVDKYSVKEYVAGIIGREYIIPTIGVWNTPEEINWEVLPNQFVLKCTHDSGGVVICKNKQLFDIEASIAKLNKLLKTNYYYQNREWPYKNVPKRIIAEKYIAPSPYVKDLPDYKWYCFGGEPKYCQVIQDRSTNETIDFYDSEWRHQDFIGLMPVVGPNFSFSATKPARPKHLETHLRIARELSKNIPFSRIDLYETGENTYFGEITFYPMSGMGTFEPDQYNEILGQMIKLPGENRGGVIIRQLETNELLMEHLDLLDYKFFCFNGEPKYCQVISGRNGKMCIDFFDHDWIHQPFHEPKDFPFADIEPRKPECFELMWDLSKKLAKNKSFSRIDFYQVNGQVFFGEITFFPTSGMGGFDPVYYDNYFGEMIVLDT